jgi:asparagine synthase (glutamine-hydrolysing)
MCGIIGYFNLAADQSPQEMRQSVERMATTLRHRGPDDAGVWTDPKAGIALGFRRLAILDLSSNGAQPMTSADGRYVIIFNGEIYNHRELRAELEESGFSFRGTSDTEVMLAGCSRWGAEATVPKLWGMFAIALWDRVEQTLLLARDRLGKKPLYYGKFGSTYLFGSELKGLHAHPDFSADVDRDVLAMYTRFGYIPNRHSIFRGVNKLPPGHVALLRRREPVQVKPYWQVRKFIEDSPRRPTEISAPEAVDELERLLRDSVARRMIADVPLGALLSGGIDSSTVVALMQAQINRPVKTFSIGFKEAAYNEADAAKRVASHLGTDHTELYVTPEEAQSVIPQLPDLYDEPFADSSQIPTFLVCRLARRHVTVSLSGDGGDELFSGYSGYRLAQNVWNRLRLVPRSARSAAASTIQKISAENWDSLYSKVQPILPQRLRRKMLGDQLYKLARVAGVADADALHHMIISIWKSPDQLVLGGRELLTPLSDAGVREGIPNFTERMMYFDLITYLPDDILVKVDRASMGVSLEARCPLLDHRVVEFAWRLPLSYKQRDGYGKWILREVLHRYVPRHLVDRPKMGFGVPIDIWLRGPLRDWAESLLDERRLEHDGFFDARLVRSVWAEHLQGSLNHQHRLWTILMFQAWKAKWLN